MSEASDSDECYNHIASVLYHRREKGSICREQHLVLVGNCSTCLVVLGNNFDVSSIAQSPYRSVHGSHAAFEMNRHLLLRKLHLLAIYNPRSEEPEKTLLCRRKLTLSLSLLIPSPLLFRSFQLWEQWEDVALDGLIVETV